VVGRGELLFHYSTLFNFKFSNWETWIKYADWSKLFTLFDADFIFFRQRRYCLATASLLYQFRDSNGCHSLRDATDAEEAVAHSRMAFSDASETNLPWNRVRGVLCAKMLTSEDVG
jgi:hypothetical protein